MVEPQLGIQDFSRIQNFDRKNKENIRVVDIAKSRLIGKDSFVETESDNVSQYEVNMKDNESWDNFELGASGLSEKGVDPSKYTTNKIEIQK